MKTLAVIAVSILFIMLVNWMVGVALLVGYMLGGKK